MLEETKAPIRAIFDDAHGLAGMNPCGLLSLHVPKMENVSIPSASQPSSEHVATGVPCRDAPAALCELKARLGAHDSAVGSRADEHRKSIKVSHRFRGRPNIKVTLRTSSQKRAK
jgi:hypothetical protein